MKISIVFIVVISVISCKTSNYYINNSDSQKIEFIKIDTVFKVITDDSIKLRIGFERIPKDSIPFKFLRVEMIFDVNNDTNFKNDLGIGFLAFLPDSSGQKPPQKTTVNNILKHSAIKALFQYTSPTSNGFCYIIKDMNYQGNYLIVNISKKSNKLFDLITNDLKWNIIASYGDGLYHENQNMYSDYFSPFYNEELRYQKK